MDDALTETQDGLEFEKCPHNESHYFTTLPLCEAEFVMGNANCKRVTRVLLYCVHCSVCRYEDDPNSPEIK